MLDKHVIIHPSAVIAEDVTIGPWTTIGENVELGAGTTIGSHSVIEKNTKAVDAAAKIHSDISKGFIKAEVISYNDVIKYNGRVGASKAGVARYEGKDYIVKDGDVILFFHN